VKSGEELEGTNGADRWPRTGKVHESSRRQVLRFSASLDHHRHSLPGFENYSWQYATKLAQITKARQGEPEGRQQPMAQICAFTPNVGMAIRNRMFHADHRPHHEGRIKNQQAGNP
jgi:hypothetical protein